MRDRLGLAITAAGNSRVLTATAAQLTASCPSCPSPRSDQQFPSPTSQQTPLYTLLYNHGHRRFSGPATPPGSRDESPKSRKTWRHRPARRRQHLITAQRDGRSRRTQPDPRTPQPLDRYVRTHGPLKFHLVNPRRDNPGRSRPQRSPISGSRWRDRRSPAHALSRRGPTEDLRNGTQGLATARSPQAACSPRRLQRRSGLGGGRGPGNLRRGHRARQVSHPSSLPTLLTPGRGSTGASP